MEQTFNLKIAVVTHENKKYFSIEDKEMRILFSKLAAVDFDAAEKEDIFQIKKSTGEILHGYIHYLKHQGGYEHFMVKEPRKEIPIFFSSEFKDGDVIKITTHNYTDVKEYATKVLFRFFSMKEISEPAIFNGKIFVQKIYRDPNSPN